MISPKKIKNTINTAVVHAMGAAKRYIGKLRKPAKQPDRQIEDTCEHEKRDAIADGRTIISKRKIVKQFPLYANVKLDIRTCQLPVPLGVIKFSDIYSKTAHPATNYE